MKNFIQKSLFTLSVISLMLSSGAQAAIFTELMKLGIMNSNYSDTEVVIYNDDQTKCLSTYEQNGRRSDNLAYTACLMEGTDTWVINSVGKIKNKRNGKCLSTPTGEDSLILVHCNYLHFRDNTAHEFIILDHLVDADPDGVDIADIRH